MSSQETFRQELPPPGGYKPVQFNRIPARQFLNTYAMFGGVIAIMAFGTWAFKFQWKRNRRLDLERRSAEYALLPLLMAEKDRAYLKQLRKNRDEEERLMANVPGWVVGTLWGEPVYKTVGDKWMDQSLVEYYSHTSSKYLNRYLEYPRHH